MFSRKLTGAAAAMIAGVIVASAASGAHAQSAGVASSRTPFRLAQACGWYAITHCSRSLAAARSFAARQQRRFGSGRVIDTSSGRYPNFRPGFYCVVDGPMSRQNALGSARVYRHEEMSGSAYAKSAC